MFVVCRVDLSLMQHSEVHVQTTSIEYAWTKCSTLVIDLGFRHRKKTQPLREGPLYNMNNTPTPNVSIIDILQVPLYNVPYISKLHAASQTLLMRGRSLKETLTNPSTLSLVRDTPLNRAKSHDMKQPSHVTYSSTAVCLRFLFTCCSIST